MTELQIRSLIKSSESEWLEFKKDNIEPDTIGENISAISNTVTLLNKGQGYIVWGVDNNKQFIGTNFKPKEYKVGNEELENWLLKLLGSQINFSIHEEIIDAKRIVIFKISPARIQPTRFKETDYIRVGSYTKKLKDYPEKERNLWKVFETKTFEEDIALGNIEPSEVLNLIDYSNYFRKINQTIPENHASILERLETEKIVTKNSFSNYSITNLGALLFSHDLGHFHSLRHKVPRVIVYAGSDKTKGVREKHFKRGYAIEFENIVEYIDSQVPKNEEIKRALRQEVSMFPLPAVRELVANALIHQDFYLQGSNPMIEIFSNRIDISNAGTPLIDTLRFIDEPSKSRNELLVDFMRRINISEKRGSGIDKVITQTELYQLPAPDFRKTQFSTITTLFATKPFSKMSKEERVRACYQHACLQWVSDKKMTNTTLRKRFGVEEKKYTMVSKVIRESIEYQMIKKKNDNSSYIPFWA